MSATTDASQGTASLSAAAARLAEAAGGAQALVFARGEGSRLRLRAAAGVESAETAQRLSAAWMEGALEALGAAQPVRWAPSEDMEAGGVWLHSLGADGDACGVVALAAPTGLEAQDWEQLAPLIETIAQGLSAERPASSGDSAQDPVPGDVPAPPPEEAAESAWGMDAGDPEENEGEELLRLSEALFAQDIELMRQRERLGMIERLKDDFIEKMSRELRTPLNHMIEAIISVLTGEDGSLSESSKATLRTALDEGSAFQRTLNNILELWRIKQGELPIEIQDVNFRELVDEAIFSVQDTLGDRPVRIETELIEPLPRLRTDLAKLNQILFLLLDNAVKFTPEGCVRIIGQVVDGELRVEIRDEGIGICHDDLEYVFDEFFQVDESASQKYRGAGLGLTLVKELVSLLDGEIRLQSDVAQGTRVVVTLPVQTL